MDVLSTSTQTGSIKIAWARPLSTPGNLDTTYLKGPYTYTLKYIDSTGNISAIFSVTKNTIGLLDNSYIHSNINTTLKGHTYQVDFMSDGVLIGSSQKASSVFLESVSPTEGWILAGRPKHRGIITVTLYNAKTLRPIRTPQ